MSLRIALTQRVVVAAGTGERRDCLAQDWGYRFCQWDMVPMPVPNGLDDPFRLLSHWAPDLLVLTGGDDLGATPDRDATEEALLEGALAAGLPVLGVCRGLQLINRHFGGVLAAVEGHVASRHAVRIEPPWQEFYGAAAEVNSFHSWGVAPPGLGKGLVPAAFDPDGRIEAFHLPGRPLAAVMWHPERGEALAADRRLIEILAQRTYPWR